ncbi:phosphoribosyltransferase [Methylobacterium sp. WL69]|uniref:phosphoribosyltransferase n=1 Tax=Methylobacterium sp. WL69 TaxID=2603893 RepID=UPI0011C82AE9|nr:phosphoribosyltransferase [Methylobacterium sp. WL69]TXM70943.1 phosphoribosyltransferase [Methylobacterium sp. WL69]
MPQNTPKKGRHDRVPWEARDPRQILVHSTFGKMRGTHQRPAKEAEQYVARYERAKRGYCPEAAAEIVEECVDMRIVDLLIDALFEVNKPALIVCPCPGFNDGHDDPVVNPLPTNAIPAAFSALLAAELGCDVDADIIQIARPGRTVLNKFERYLWQPCYEGAVRSDRAYIIADDVCTNGGTLAMLRSHIVSQGGTVIAATTLGHTTGNSQSFPIERATLGVLMSAYGSGLQSLWREEIGHEPQCLTDGEGIGLAEWTRERVGRGTQERALQCLRDRFAEARGNASERARSGTAS